MVTVIVEWAQSRGWTIETDSTGCRRFYDPQGNYIAYWAPPPNNSNYRWYKVPRGCQAAAPTPRRPP